MNGACTHIGNTDFAWFATSPREEPAELPGAFAGWRHRLRDQRRGAGLHARPEPLGAGDRPARERWAQKQAPQRPGGVDGPSRAPRHHPAPGHPDPLKIATEGALWGSVVAHGLLKDATSATTPASSTSALTRCAGSTPSGSSTSWSASTTASGRRVRGSGRGCGGSTPT